MLHSDIGINISGYMHILFKKGTLLPAETELMVKPASNNVELSLYQGPHAYIENNHFIGSTQLINSNGKFTLRFIIGDIIHVYIEQLICEFTYKKDDLGDPSKEDLENHEIEKARQDYTDYIRETLSTLEEVRDKIDQSIIDKVLWASEVSNVKEITKEEFELAQKEIEDWLNPILASTSRFASASTASANHT